MGWRRRRVVAAIGALAAGLLAGGRPGSAQDGAVATRVVPSSGEAIPAVGLGSWITFNVGDDTVLRDECAQVMGAFFAAGGRMIDSSPMYGSAQPVIGYGLDKLGRPAQLFAADKVWSSSGGAGAAQIDESRNYWGVPRFDLLQVHNLLNWEAHLPALQAMKADGTLRYAGITTSEGRRHAEFIEVMRTQPIDFVQVTYNILDREVEESILPLAQERGIGVIVNRPFRQGVLIRRIEDYPLPDWAEEINCANWAQFLLKFIVSHPAVTCAIPATTSALHVQENLGAARGRMPEAAMRQRMIAYVEDL